MTDRELYRLCGLLLKSDSPRVAAADRLAQLALYQLPGPQRQPFWRAMTYTLQNLRATTLDRALEDEGILMDIHRAWRIRRLYCTILYENVVLDKPAAG